MKYCSQCESEYENDTAVCADCGSNVFVERLPETVQLFSGSKKDDPRHFVPVEMAEDPLTTQHYIRVLESAHIPVLALSHQWNSMDVLTSAWLHGWWEITVPREHSERAKELLRNEQEQINAWAIENAQAAEAEATAQT